MKRKIIAIGIIAAFASGLLGGCGSNNTPPAGSSTDEAAHAEVQTDSSFAPEEAHASDDNAVGQAAEESLLYDQLMELRTKQDLDSLNPDNFNDTPNVKILILAENDDDIHDIETMINAEFTLFDRGSNIYECDTTVDDPIVTIKSLYKDNRVIYAMPLEPERPD